MLLKAPISESESGVEARTKFSEDQGIGAKITILITLFTIGLYIDSLYKYGFRIFVPLFKLSLCKGF